MCSVVCMYLLHVCIYRSVSEDPGARVGEGTAEEEELDKEFWIKRAGGVSLCVCVCV